MWGLKFADVEHFFCSCEKIARLWSWVKCLVEKLLGQRQIISDWDLLNFFLPSSDYEMENVWLVSSYVLYVCVRGAEVKIEQFFGFLTYKNREHQAVSKVQLKHLDQLNWKTVYCICLLNIEI